MYLYIHTERYYVVPAPYVHTYVQLDAIYIHMYVSMYVYACMYDIFKYHMYIYRHKYMHTYICTHWHLVGPRDMYVGVVIYSDEWSFLSYSRAR